MKVKTSKYYRNIGQRAEIRIDPWDTNSIEITLARIILPLLLEHKDRAPSIPSELIKGIEVVDYNQMCFDFIHEDSATPYEQAEKEWNEILDKMIWSFQQILTGDWDSNYHHIKPKVDFETMDYISPTTDKLEIFRAKNEYWYDRVGHELHYQRIREGLELFGKYMLYLWV